MNSRSQGLISPSLRTGRWVVPSPWKRYAVALCECPHYMQPSEHG